MIQSMQTKRVKKIVKIPPMLKKRWEFRLNIYVEFWQL